MFIALKKYESKKSKIKYNLAMAALLLICSSAFFTFIFYLLKGSGVDVDMAVVSEMRASIFSSDTGDNYVLQSSEFSIWRWIEANNYRISLTWMIGVILFSLRLIIGKWYLNSILSSLDFTIDPLYQHSLNQISKQVGLGKLVRIASSSKIEIPMLIGHLKPIIILPIAAANQLTIEETECIIVHELGHVLRNDYLQNMFIIVVESLFFFNPTIWWICNVLKSERENSCDDLVLQLYPDRLSYARALYKLQENAQKTETVFSLQLFKNKKNLLQRVKRILNQPMYQSYLKERGLATLLIVISIFTFATASDIFENKIEPLKETIQWEKEHNCIDEQTQIITIRPQTHPSFPTGAKKINEFTRFSNTTNVQPIANNLATTKSLIVTTSESEHNLKNIDINSHKRFVFLSKPSKTDSDIFIAMDTIDENDWQIFNEDFQIEMEGLNEMTEELSERLSKDMKGFTFEFIEKHADKMKELSDKVLQFSYAFSDNFQNSSDWKNKEREIQIRLDSVLGPEWEHKMSELTEKINIKLRDSLDLQWSSKISEKLSNKLNELHFNLEDSNFAFIFSDNDQFKYKMHLEDSEESSAVIVELLENLNKEGLLTDGNNVLDITNEYTEINGRKLDANAHNKYKALIKKHINTAFDTKTSIRIAMKGKDMSRKGNRTVSISIKQ